MFQSTFSFASLSFLGALSVFLLGCGGSQTDTADSAASVQNTADRSLAGQTSGNSDNTTDRSSAPKKTVALFLDSLRRGDETTANSMLTTKARQELQKTEYVMQPLGTPEGQYNIGRVEFPYPDQELALVECRWVEPATGELPELVMEIVCETYREAEGYRIAGIAVTVADEQDPLVIDFEDGTRLQQMLEMANGTAPTVESSQVAQPTQSTGQAPANDLPALPAFPSQGEQEIAMPPGMRNVLR
jgi:hypothetical protein